MKHITEAMFPEFRFLPYIVYFFIALGLTVSITGSRKLLFFYIVLTVIGGSLAMMDFYRWGYDYGHHLDPNAPIQVPGLSYQPPLFGHKRLLNFDAYSFPDVAGWAVVGAGSLAFFVWLFEFYRRRRPMKAALALASTGIALMLISSCSSNPEKLQAGKDNCDFCKMAVSDIRFGGEIITRAGRIYKFDDLHCLRSFLEKGIVPSAKIERTVLVNFDKPDSFIDISNAALLVSDAVRTPMASHTAAFGSASAAEQNRLSDDDKITDWKTWTLTTPQ